MFRDAAKRHLIFSCLKPIRATRCFASSEAGKADEEDLAIARKWLTKLDADTIRQNAACDVTFSRSSGPGGQNVNKYISIVSIDSAPY